jgi:hypothetical protein
VPEIQLDVNPHQPHPPAATQLVSVDRPVHASQQDDAAFQPVEQLEAWSSGMHVCVASHQPQLVVPADATVHAPHVEKAAQNCAHLLSRKRKEFVCNQHRQKLSRL